MDTGWMDGRACGVEDIKTRLCTYKRAYLFMKYLKSSNELADPESIIERGIKKNNKNQLYQI